jgi:DNA polymerase elongation subunit (family B)
MKKGQFFAYSWKIDKKEEDVTAIRIYGIDENNMNICVRVNNFTPYVYVELPDKITWTQAKAQIVGNKIDELLGERKPLEKVFEMKNKLYGVHNDANGNPKQFPYLKCLFSSRDDARALGYTMRRTHHIVGMGAIKFKIHERDADEILQLTCARDLPTAGWIEFAGSQVAEESMVTLCDKEFVCRWKMLGPSTRTDVPDPMVMSFDLEVNSSNPARMPQANQPHDKIFQISCIFKRGSSGKQEDYLLTLGKPDHAGVGSQVVTKEFDTESDLLQGWTMLVREKNPNVIIGYNIFGFDIPYMIDRAKALMCMYPFDQQGFHKTQSAIEKTIKWSSSAYGKQEFQFLDAEGRLFVDLLPLVQRDYKMANYQLKTISTHFLGETKDPLSHHGIFKCYKLGMIGGPKGAKALGIVGKYCVQDSVLVLKLFEHLQSWLGLCEMATTCRIPIFGLYTQGQQIRVYSQIYKYCMDNNKVVENDAYTVTDNERYVGAHVFDPVPGVYDMVTPVDFASLYPTTIIAYNIDYSTWVTDESIPDSKCHVMSWSDHIGCIVEGSLVTVGEFSLPIETLMKNRDHILAHSGDGSLTYHAQTNFFDQGVKECVLLTLEDGQELRCTPDHKILTSTLEWKEAGSLTNQDRVCTGHCPPVYDIGDAALKVGDYEFKGESLIKFWKLVGLMCTDGHCTHNRTKLYCGHLIDLQNVVRDIESLEAGSTSQCVENYGWGVAILGKLGKAFRDMPGILWGKKSTQVRTLPFQLQSASSGEICAFLSGLIGGDGHTFSFSAKAQSIGNIAISWSAKDPSLLLEVFIQLRVFLTELGIGSTIDQRAGSTILNIAVSSSALFEKKIGFSYCVHKSTRLQAGCSYLALRDNVWKQQNQLIERTIVLKREMSVVDAITKARDELVGGPVFSEYYSNPTLAQMTEFMRPRRSCKKPMFSRKYFPCPIEYIESIGGKDLFSSYSVPRDHKNIPTLAKKVIFVQKIGKHHVYDLEVEKSHSFLASGVVVHNCVHDPKVIRRMKLDTIISAEKAKVKEVRDKRNKTSGALRKKELMDVIKHMEILIKPYTEERSHIMKTKPKFPMCAARYYRFLKEPRGVMPTVIQNLLDARKHTRMQQKENIKKMKEDPSLKNTLTGLNSVLEKRQLAYKVSANSMYGAMGARKGYLPFMPGAMCTTYMGRTNIEIVAKVIPEKYKGELVYGDTDSNYIHFPHLKTAQEAWDYTEWVAAEVTKLFPPPIKLEFENVVYWRFFILTKKRYMYKECGADGIVSDKVGKKGVLLARRDNSAFVRFVYEKVVMMVFDKVPRDDIITFVIEQINRLFSGCIDPRDFVITKAVGDTGGMHPIQCLNEKGEERIGLGQYKVKPLPKSKEDREKQFKLKNTDSVNGYYTRCLPAHVQLAEKMKARGQRVDTGSRLEYIICDQCVHTAKQYDKVESIEYFLKHRNALQLDFMSYLKLLAVPLDGVIDLVGSNDKGYKKGIVMEQYNYRLKVRSKVIEQIKGLSAPLLVFED